MIVWGGAASSSGGRYDPSTDQWTATSMGANVPSPRRHGHIAVWTGAEMIVWGGHTSVLINTGGRYDPSSNSWTATSTGSNTPGGREFPTAAWTGTEIIFWGGLSTPTTGGRYCACPDGALVYRDLDGDGRGDPGLVLPSCDGSIPAGYVADHTDCDDANAAVHPGAVEVCNGIDEDCDGTADDVAPFVCDDSDPCTIDACASGACANTPQVTPEVNASLLVSKTMANAIISWTDPPGPFNVYRGSRTGLPWTYDASCLDSGTSGPSTDTDFPVPAVLTFYLVSRTGVCGESILGRDSNGTAIPNSAPCP